MGNLLTKNQWRFPANKSKEGVETDFSLKGAAGRNILSQSDDIISILLDHHTEDYKAERRAVSHKYQQVLEFLNKRVDFTEANILNFQDMIDDYAELWKRLTSRDGQKNYELFIERGHLSHYLSLYGNLYKYSQQGFEAMMSKVKCIYSRCTSHGGNG